MHRLVSLAAVMALAGCDPFAFDDLQDSAPVFAVEAPEAYPRRGFPGVLTGFAGTLDGTPASRLAATGGAASPFVVYRAWSAGTLALGGPFYDGCDDLGECDDGAGAALAGVPVWRAGTPEEGRMCLLIGAPTAGALVVRCEMGGDAAVGGERFVGPASTRFAASAVGIGADNPVGVALVGAPDAGSGAGALYRLPDGGSPVLIEAEELDAALLPGGRLGLTLAAARLPTGETIVAAGAPRELGETGTRRVVVLVLTEEAEAVNVSVRACLDREEEGWARALAWGDVDGDGAPDLMVGGGPAVVLYSGDGLPDPGGCAEWGRAGRELACPGHARENLASCEDADFGAALAAGDVNADGRDDLLVGAPRAAVDGTALAGAVFLIPGTEGGLDEAAADVLTHSTPQPDDRLGRPLTTIATDLEGVPRAEPVAGAPGRDSALVFLCSGVDGDTPAVGSRCIPR